jgi:hypothetical protein
MAVGDADDWLWLLLLLLGDVDVLMLVMGWWGR